MRSADGSCNNLEHPEWGARHTTFMRLMPPAYEDGKILVWIKKIPIPPILFHKLSLWMPPMHVIGPRDGPFISQIRMSFLILFDRSITSTTYKDVFRYDNFRRFLI